MTWNEAIQKSAEMGMRLPKCEEFTAAYKAKLTESWSEGNLYWTSDSYSEDKAFVFDIVTGNRRTYSTNLRENVRCIF